MICSGIAIILHRETSSRDYDVFSLVSECDICVEPS